MKLNLTLQVKVKLPKNVIYSSTSQEEIEPPKIADIHTQWHTHDLLIEKAHPQISLENGLRLFKLNIAK